jgi:hypothetical protein
MQQAGERFIDYDGTWLSGVKSDNDPAQLPIGYAWQCVNMINLGGLLTCRPGYRCLVTFPPGRLQGCFIFHPIASLEQMLVAVSGNVFVADYPFVDFRLVPNVSLSPDSPLVYWAQTYQSAKRDTPGSLISSITVIPTKSVVIMQDGGSSAPAFYDGSQSGHIKGNLFGTPAGGPMQWVGDRLWVGVGNQVFASDVDNPFSFVENIYLGGVSAFTFASEVTAMVITPSIESPQLMVFTSVNGSILQANIRDRNSWPTTPNFQEEVIQVGCNAHRSAISHFGRLVWFGPSGLSFFDPAMSGKITTRLPIRDNEMLSSKVYVDNDNSMVAAGAFGQFLLLSVPAEDNYNKHTWVLNHASLTTLSDDSGPAWCGYWTGTRPVEWAYGNIAGTEKIYYVSVDNDGQNRLWEAFQPNCLDNGCPITWAMFSRGYFGATATTSPRPPGERCRLLWTNAAICGIQEDLDIGIFYAGGMSSQFLPLMTKLVRVEKGSLDSTQEITASSLLFGFKPQSRVLTSEDANMQAQPVDEGCGVEKFDSTNIDTSFQILVVGQGPATLRYIRPFAQTVAPQTSGNGKACEDEVNFHASRYDGAAVSAPDVATLIETLAQAPEYFYTSAKTETIQYKGLSGVGVGFAQSIISQKAADRVASIVATQFAAQQIVRQLPSVLSVGLQ